MKIKKIIKIDNSKLLYITNKNKLFLYNMDSIEVLEGLDAYIWNVNNHLNSFYIKNNKVYLRSSEASVCLKRVKKENYYKYLHLIL